MDTIHFNDKGSLHMVAHRGCSGLEMENTCSAFVAAGNRSYWGIETDVHVTADGGLIIIHDDDLKRVAGDDISVEGSTYETLRAIHLKDKDQGRTRNDLVLPSLEEYLRICKKYDKYSVLELKNHMEPEVLDRILATVKAEGQLEHTIFISFDLANMIYVRKCLPSQAAQYLMDGFPDDLIDTLCKHHLDLDIRYTFLTRERVEQLHAKGIQVNVWTVNTLEEARALKEMGVDYITSNVVE